jgi:hypothetical protein
MSGSCIGEKRGPDCRGKRRRKSLIRDRKNSPGELGRVVRRVSIDDLLQRMRAQQSEHSATLTLFELLKQLDAAPARSCAR